MSKISRRQLLTTTAAGVAALALGTGFGSLAQAGSSASSSDAIHRHTAACAHNHHALGHELSTLIADPKVDDAVKNHFIKTASCPTCGTGIAPTGLGLAVSTWT